MSPLDLLPNWTKLAIAAVVVGALTAAAAWSVHVQREIGRDEVRAEWSAEKALQGEQALADANANAEETQRRLRAQQEIQHVHDQEVARYERALVDARSARDGLQRRVAELSAAAGRAASDTATADERQAGAAAAAMLADLSRGSDELAEVYARVADASRSAGLQCERDYDALTAAISQ